jgi:spore maturation protein CgeB
MSAVRTLYIGLKYDYGNPKRGLSFEYVNFYETLKQMKNIEVNLFPFDEVMRNVGRKKMNESLLQVIREMKPQVCFFVLFTDEISKKTIQKISDTSNAVTLNWFGDDHWRFENYSKNWAKLFHWVVTTDSKAEEKYYDIGCKNVIKSQWGFNPNIYKRENVSYEYDITFVGQVHSNRKTKIDSLIRDGISVQCWGKGWENGRLSQEEMVSMYSRSKINLNFAESSPALRWKPIAKVFLNRRANGAIILNFPKQMRSNVALLFQNIRPQIKGRNFEIPGAGGFLLTEHADNLEEYFSIGKEIITFHSQKDLEEKIHYYLKNESERETIRFYGYERAQRDHTFEKRISSILNRIRIS